MKLHKYLILLYLTLSATVRLSAYNLRQITNKDGLTNSAVLSLMQDRQGFLWLGTCGGLNIYDGIRITPATFSGKTGLSGNLIENIRETDDGTLWIETNYGLDCLNRKHNQITHFSQFQGRYLLRTFHNNVLIISEEDSLYFYKDNHFQVLPFKDFPQNDILDIYFHENDLQVFSTQGVFQYTLKTNSWSLQNRKVIDRTPLQYCFVSGQYAYMVSQDGKLYEYNSLHGTKQYIIDLSEEIGKRGIISDIIASGQTRFVAFQTNGILKLSPAEEGFQAEDIGIRSGIFRLLKDKNQDIIWIATDGQGVYIYSDGPYSLRSITYNDLNQPIAKPTRSIFLDRENTLWLGTKGEGLLKFKDYKQKNHSNRYMTELLTTHNSALSDNSVYALADSKRPLFWIGNDEGIDYYSYEEKKIKSVTTSEPIRYVHAIYEEGDSVLWIATVGTGIIRARIEGAYNAPQLTHIKRYTIDKGLFSSNYFFTLFADEEQGKIYFGNRGFGTWEIRNDQLVNIPMKGTYSEQTINDVFALSSDKNTLWIGTSYGLIKRTDDKEESYTQDNGFRNSTVHSLLRDNTGQLWISTNYGLIRFNTQSSDFQTYDEQNGLNVIEFSDGASFKKGNMLFFGGTEGIAIVQNNTSYHSSGEYMPPILFNRLNIAGKEQNMQDFLWQDGDKEILTLQYDQNYFSISFVAIDYLNSNNYVYQYKIGDNEKNWIDNGTSNQISFTSMEPGEYTLYVRYKNLSTGKESQTYTFRICVRPPWYLSPAAVMAYYVLVLALLIVIYRIWLGRQRKKQQEIVNQLEQIHKEEVYEEKLRFFTNITHEFCTPLTLIYGPCERLLTYQQSDDYITRYVRLIKSNAERLNALIQEVIDFRRLETGHKVRKVEATNISKLCDEIIQSFSELSEQNRICVDSRIGKDIVWNTDKSCITKIINNLISNAFKYTPTDGIIRITLNSTNDNELKLSVYNTGKGIKNEDREFIFNRYSVLDNVEGNTMKGLSSRNGLGMAICHSMVELLEGTINIESEVDQYAEFIVTLPLLEITHEKSTNEQKSYERPLSQPQPLNTEKTADDVTVEQNNDNIPKSMNDSADDKPMILVIDDNEEILALLKDTLSDYKVQTAKSAKAGLKILTKETAPDLIITDIMMPGISGIEFTQQIKQNKHLMHVPIVILSAKNANEEHIEGLAAGADAYIGKPFDVNYLEAIVARLIENKKKVKEYYNSSACAYEFTNGQLLQKEDKDLLTSITQFIDDNLDKADLSPEDLAAHLGFSVRNLYRKFKELNQPTPKDFIKAYRMTFAAKLLTTTTLTVQEIIYRCGFNNRSHFYKEFDKHYQMTPKDYRNQTKQKDDSLNG